MSNKVKCRKCGLLIDDSCDTCPYCGYPLDKNKDTLKNDIKSDPNNQNTFKENKEEENIKRRPVHDFFVFSSREISISSWKQYSLFLLCFIGLSILVTLFTTICQFLNLDYFLSTSTASAALNFSLYIVLFGIMICILNKDSLKITSAFKKINTYSRGICFGIFLIFASSLVSFLMGLIRPSTSNDNQMAIDSIVSLYPVLSILVFGILGPLCEELAYRVGLFSAMKRINRVLAYVVVCVVFGMIHFNFAATDLINELINIPSYIVAGLILSFAYDKGGIGCSMIAHVTNNLTSIIISIIAASIL